jgi:UDP:flavonoid glycosyltransferase YjiC (YdhE family)
MAISCLFIINGLGLGNSTRCLAVIEQLAAAGCRIHVLTSGNGLSFFRGHPNIESLTAMESFYYSRGRSGISGWSTLKSVVSLAKVARSKWRDLEKLLFSVKPDVAIVDSEYVIGPLRRRRIPILAINNSEVVVTEYLKHRRVARGVGSHFWFVEFMDYLFHRIFCDMVLSPFPLPRPTRHPKFRRIGLIVRAEVRRQSVMAASLPRISPRQIRTAVFMLSGSIHASEIDFGRREFPFAVEIVGRSGVSRGNVTFHGRLLDNLALLERADVFVINGGYSALSEAFAFRKPAFVIPVPGHAEQFVNARLAAELGVGFVAHEGDVLDRLMEMYQQDRWINLVPLPAAFELEGDCEAARAILDYAESRQSGRSDAT